VRRWAAGLGLLAVAAIAALPSLTASTYVVAFLYSVFIAAILAQSYDWVGGHMGYLNLGHASFFGIGAYTFGILFKTGQPLLLALLAGVLLAALFAVAISYPFFRLRGAYFALATFVPTGYRLYHAYYASLGLLAGLVAATAWLAGSRLGLALAASAAVAGLAGGLYCWNLTYIIPGTVFGLDVAVGPIVMAMLGGSGTIVGPVLGALVVDVIREALRFHTPHLALTIYGGMLVLVGLFLPGGLAEPRRWRRLARRLAGGER
jgi:branched-chain amino acid transport system permease protein